MHQHQYKYGCPMCSRRFEKQAEAKEHIMTFEHMNWANKKARQVSLPGKKVIK